MAICPWNNSYSSMTQKWDMVMTSNTGDMFFINDANINNTGYSTHHPGRPTSGAIHFNTLDMSGTPTQKERLLIRGDGLVVVGGLAGTGTLPTPTSPLELKFLVNGTAVVKELFVNTAWADFVFDKDYKLMPLGEVEQKIQQNGHLPGIPSAKEVEASGISVGDMSAKLLMKIEELTLYMIDLKKENEKLHNRLEQIEAGASSDTPAVKQ
jgi:hypothetical protein